MATRTHEVISPQLAEDYLKFNTKNRPVNKQLVANIAKDIARGAWIYDGNPIRFSESGALIDGQHRLLACIKAGKQIESDVVRGLADDAFKVIDTGRTRSGGDLISTLGVANAKTISAAIVYRNSLWSNRQLQLCDRVGGKDFERLSKEQIVDFYLENIEICDEAGRIASSFGNGNRGIRILSASFIGGFYLFFVLDLNHPKERVEDFFTQLQTGENITNKTIITLRESFIKHKLKQSLLTTKQRDIYFRKTWNAFVTGKELDKLKYDARENDIDYL